MPPTLAMRLLSTACCALVLTGCTSEAARPTAAPVAATSAPSSAPSSAAALPGPTLSSTPSALPSLIPSAAPAPATPSASALPAAPTPAASPAAELDVRAAQQRLQELGYYAGAVDERRGPKLRAAVMAFQKVQRIGVDGRIGPATLKALEAPRLPELRGQAPLDRIEVDLDLQVLYVVKGGAIERILPVSSGNGERYRQKKSGRMARAATPTGHYRIERRIVGVREADLGTLYDPQYFYRGFAIHGSNSVPAREASHGCVRVTRWDAKYLLGAVGVGTHVYIYGGRYTFKAGRRAPAAEQPRSSTAPPSAAPAPSPTPASASPAPSPAPSASPSSAPSPQS